MKRKHYRPSVYRMNIIETQRENIRRDNNTAQTDLMGMLETMDKSTTELIIQESLHGDLDLSYLGEHGFIHIRAIEFAEGEITGIKNIPESVKKLVCCKNLLSSIENLPSQVEEIDLEYNYLSRFDGSGLDHLITLCLSNNKLVEIEHLPKVLEELYMDNNEVKFIDLMDTIKLRVLHASNNPMLVLEHVPESLVDLKCENSPFVTVDEVGGDPSENVRDANAQNLNYLESLTEYFKLKSKYETDAHELRKKTYKEAATKAIGKKLLKQVKPKCVNCKRPVGTIFQLKDERYVALCGDPNAQTKCNLDIQLYRGGFSAMEYMLYLYKEQVEILKENIVREKLNVLFSYVHESTASKMFKKTMEDYNYDSSMYKELYDTYHQMYFDEERKRQIAEKIEKIDGLVKNVKHATDDYLQNKNRETLRDAMKMQIRDVEPEIENLRRLKYELMEMNNMVNVGGSPMNPELMILCSLFQKDVALSKLDYTFGEKPRVIKFMTRGKK